ncbi:MAG: hypothetical protein BWK75_04580 [Candidatus Altiarchaeales archaeon A3]|nr:MAG: hypothetical protein BWK75_04580 [Candidatus Altiarchaeales archaeon A3]
MDNIKILNLVWIFVISVFLIVTVIAAVDASDSTNKPGVIEINISPIKDVYYTGDEININFVLEPNKNGCFAMLTLTKINGTQNVLFQHQRGCKSCGSAKSPLTSKISKSINKKFDEPGIYDIEALMEDAETYKSDFKNIKIIVKDREVEKVMVKEEDIADNENTQIPIVIEVFTRDGCPICYHVDEGAKKLANEYTKKTKTA